MSQKNPPERPKITEEHRNFKDRIIGLSNFIGLRTAYRLREYCGAPPTDLAADRLQDFATFFVQFDRAPDAPHSRPLPGSIAGSDFFHFSSIINPNESASAGGGPTDLHYPARILELVLGYGSSDDPEAQLWPCKLYTGEDTAPVIVSEAAIPQDDQHDFNFRGLTHYLGSLPANAFHCPNGEELRTIRTGLFSLQEEGSMYGLASFCYTDLEGSGDPTAVQAEMEWFRECQRKLEA